MNVTKAYAKHLALVEPRGMCLVPKDSLGITDEDRPTDWQIGAWAKTYYNLDGKVFRLFASAHRLPPYPEEFSWEDAQKAADWGCGLTSGGRSAGDAYAIYRSGGVNGVVMGAFNETDDLWAWVVAWTVYNGTQSVAWAWHDPGNLISATDWAMVVIDLGTPMSGLASNTRMRPIALQYGDDNSNNIQWGWHIPYVTKAIEPALSGPGQPA